MYKHVYVNPYLAYLLYAPSDEITQRCSAKYNVLSHPRHLLVRSLIGSLNEFKKFRSHVYTVLQNRLIFVSSSLFFLAEINSIINQIYRLNLIVD